MSQGDYPSLSISVPIKNRDFCEGTSFATTFASNYTTETTIVANDLSGTPPGLLQTIRSGDVILLGPSTNTTDSGKKEYVTVKSIAASGSDFSIVLLEAPTYDYQSGDTISGIGTALAGGWDLSSANISMSGIGGVIGDGKFDDYRQSLILNASGQQFKQTNIPALVNGYTYRLGYYIKRLAGTGSSGSRIGALVSVNGGSTFPYSDIYYGTSSAVWIEKSLTFTVNSTILPSYTTVITFLFVEGAPDFDIDLITLEHANSTTTASTGMYTFGEYPSLGSVRWEYEQSEDVIMKRSGRRSFYDSSGRLGKFKLVNYEATYEHVSQSFWDDLMVLHTWQSKGNDVIFRPYLDDLSPILIGRFYLQDVTKSLWDLSRTSFKFVFLESGN